MQTRQASSPDLGEFSPLPHSAPSGTPLPAANSLLPEGALPEGAHAGKRPLPQRPPRRKAPPSAKSSCRKAPLPESPPAGKSSFHKVPLSESHPLWPRLQPKCARGRFYENVAAKTDFSAKPPSAFAARTHRMQIPCKRGRLAAQTAANPPLCRIAPHPERPSLLQIASFRKAPCRKTPFATTPPRRKAPPAGKPSCRKVLLPDSTLAGKPPSGKPSFRKVPLPESPPLWPRLQPKCARGRFYENVAAITVFSASFGPIFTSPSTRFAAVWAASLPRLHGICLLCVLAANADGGLAEKYVFAATFS